MSVLRTRKAARNLCSIARIIVRDPPACQPGRNSKIARGSETASAPRGARGRKTTPQRCPSRDSGGPTPSTGERHGLESFGTECWLWAGVLRYLLLSDAFCHVPPAFCLPPSSRYCRPSTFFSRSGWLVVMLSTPILIALSISSFVSGVQTPTSILWACAASVSAAVKRSLFAPMPSAP